MGRKVVDHTGKRFGWLIALERITTPIGQQNKWLCKCDCGDTTIVSQGNLVKGMTKSCGCRRKSAHRANGIANRIRKD